MLVVWFDIWTIYGKYNICIDQSELPISIIQTSAKGRIWYFTCQELLTEATEVTKQLPLTTEMMTPLMCSMLRCLLRMAISLWRWPCASTRSSHSSQTCWTAAQPCHSMLRLWSTATRQLMARRQVTSNRRHRDQIFYRRSGYLLLEQVLNTNSNQIWIVYQYSVHISSLY